MSMPSASHNTPHVRHARKRAVVCCSALGRKMQLDCFDIHFAARDFRLHSSFSRFRATGRSNQGLNSPRLSHHLFKQNKESARYSERRTAERRPKPLHIPFCSTISKEPYISLTVRILLTVVCKTRFAYGGIVFLKGLTELAAQRGARKAAVSTEHVFNTSPNKSLRPLVYERLAYGNLPFATLCLASY